MSYYRTLAEYSGKNRYDNYQNVGHKENTMCGPAGKLIHCYIYIYIHLYSPNRQYMIFLHFAIKINDIDPTTLTFDPECSPKLYQVFMFNCNIWISARAAARFFTDDSSTGVLDSMPYFNIIILQPGQP